MLFGARWVEVVVISWGYIFSPKVEKHMRNVSALPAALPNIDFAAYNKVRLQRVLSGQTLHIL